jgi:hypothetical protein
MTPHFRVASHRARTIPGMFHALRRRPSLRQEIGVLSRGPAIFHFTCGAPARNVDWHEFGSKCPRRGRVYGVDTGSRLSLEPGIENQA